MKALTDTVQGGIYEYYLVKTNQVDYRGSTQYAGLNQVDNMHRNGHTFPCFNSGSQRYNMTTFRTVLRAPMGKMLNIRWVHEPQKLQYGELLRLEAKCIKEKHAVDECGYNIDDDPYAWAAKKQSRRANNE